MNPRIRPFTLWLTGQSGAGKTTLARQIARSLRRRGHPRVVVLDCETPVMDQGSGPGTAAYESLIRSLSLTADLLTRTGAIVIVAARLDSPRLNHHVREKQRAPVVVLQLKGDRRELDDLARSEALFLQELESRLAGAVGHVANGGILR